MQALKIFWFTNDWLIHLVNCTNILRKDLKIWYQNVDLIQILTSNKKIIKITVTLLPNDVLTKEA